MFFFFSSLPSFLEDWIDESSNLCVYTHMQLVKFPRVHLVDGGWYLDCSRDFVPDVEKPLYNILICFVPKIIELEEEPEEPEEYESLAPPTNEARGWPLLKYPLVLSPRHRFSALLLQSPPLSEVHPQLFLSLIWTILLLRPIAVSSSPLCTARGRPSHQIHPPLLRRGRHLFF